MHDIVKVHETSMFDLYLIRFACLVANKMSKQWESHKKQGSEFQVKTILTFFSLKNQHSFPGKYYF